MRKDDAASRFMESGLDFDTIQLYSTMLFFTSQSDREPSKSI